MVRKHRRVKSGIVNRRKVISNTKKFQTVPFFGFVIGSMILGSTGSLVTMPAIPTWYANLIKPSFNPPNWVFGPVWTLLFILMGIASYLVWKSGTGKPGVNRALLAYGLQFALNILWSSAFFGVRSPGLGLFTIIILWIAIAVTIIRFWRVNHLAGLLLAPYIAWVSFASILNTSIYLLNRV